MISAVSRFHQGHRTWYVAAQSLPGAIAIGNCPEILRPGSRRVLAAQVLLLFLFLGQSGCTPETITEQRYTRSGPALGTTYRVSIVSAPEKTDLTVVQHAVEEAISKVDLAMSTWRDDSELAGFNKTRSTNWFSVTEPLFGVISRAQDVARQTSGAFDITVAPLVEAWGFGAGGPVLNVPEDDLIRGAMEAVGYEKLYLDAQQLAVRKSNPLLSIDLSAIAKGFAVDQVAEVLEDLGFGSYLVEIGGELRASGQNERNTPWQIAVEIPHPTGGVQAVVGLEGQAIATSGDYRNFIVLDGNKYAHAINPQTGMPVAHQLASVSVIYPDAMTADALATALLVMGPRKGLSFAEENALPVLMLMREGEEIVEIISSEFLQYMEIID